MKSKTIISLSYIFILAFAIGAFQFDNSFLNSNIEIEINEAIEEDFEDEEEDEKEETREFLSSNFSFIKFSEILFSNHTFHFKRVISPNREIIVPPPESFLS